MTITDRVGVSGVIHAAKASPLRRIGGASTGVTMSGGGSSVEHALQQQQHVRGGVGKSEQGAWAVCVCARARA
eukprot:35198-Eustigmatos_ZCMA.PRE.1